MSDLKPIQGLRPFTKFCCTIGNIPASYLAGMTYEEQLLWFCDYLQNTIIPTVNNNAEAVEELQNLYKELKSYVDNYFTNLDVQEEINKKLDEMTEDGTLLNIIKPYIEPLINEQNSKINNLQSNINNLTNLVNNITTFSPIAVSSIEEMTDHNKIYVNTTDGNWYYYNTTTSSWTVGGVYQSSSLDNTTQDILNSANFFLNLFNNKPELAFPNIGGYYVDDGDYHSGAASYRTSNFILANILVGLNLTINFTDDPSVRKYNFFDINKNPISYSQENNYKEIINNNANIYYVRISEYIHENPNNVIISNALPFINIYNIVKNNGQTKQTNLRQGSYNRGKFSEITNRCCAFDYIRVYSDLNYTIEVPENCLVTVQFFDSSKNYTHYIDFTNPLAFVPENTDYYMLFNIKKTNEGDFTEEEIQNLNVLLTNYTLYKSLNITDLKPPSNKWAGKTINFLGDSITSGLGVGENFSWAKVCADTLQANCNNYGISSSTVADYENLGEHNPMCLRYSEMDNDADLIVVLASRNDYRNVPVPIGTPEDTEKDTFYGAMKILLNGLWEKYPTKQIVFCTMYKAQVNVDGGIRDNIWNNEAGFNQTDYNEVIKELCEQYAIPVIDLYNSGTFNSWNNATKNAFFQDTVHPNIEGHEFFGKLMAYKLMNI